MLVKTAERKNQNPLTFAKWVQILWRLSFVASIWTIWKERNKDSFKKSFPLIDIFAMIQGYPRH